MQGASRTRNANGRGVARGIGGIIRPDARIGGAENWLRARHAGQPDAAECAARGAGGATGRGSRVEPHDWETDTIAVLETNLDDLNAEILGHFVEKALAAGALDVFQTAIQMKKNRPGVLLTVWCAEADADKFSELMLRETSTFGIRRYTAERRKLAREFVKAQTPYGEVTVKIGRLDGKVDGPLTY